MFIVRTPCLEVPRELEWKRKEHGGGEQRDFMCVLGIVKKGGEKRRGVRFYLIWFVER